MTGSTATSPTLALPAGALLAIDANSLAYRAFHALPETMTDPSGNPTGAVYGFGSMLATLLQYRPAGLVLAWDTPGPTFRHHIDPSYKEGRTTPPASLIAQLEVIRRLARALGIAQVSDDDYEADDLIATAVSAARPHFTSAVIVTGDRDSFQLVDDATTVWWTRRGVTDIVEVTPSYMAERYNLSADGYRSLAALRGDPSDNLPGVPGVGEKTAISLLTTHRTITGIYDALDRDPTQFTPRLRENLAAHKERVALNLGLTTLHREVPSVPAPTAFSYRLPNLGAVSEICSELGLTTLWRRLRDLEKAATLFEDDPDTSLVSEPAA